MDDIKSKLQQRQEGAFKRERALAYALAQKVTNLSTFNILFKFVSEAESGILFCVAMEVNY